MKWNDEKLLNYLRCEMETITKEDALKVVLHGACKIPEIKPVKDFNFIELVWAWEKLRKRIKKIPVWLYAKSGYGYGYGNGYGYGYGDGDGDGDGYGNGLITKALKLSSERSKV